MKVSEKLGDYTTIRKSTVNYLGRTKADTSAVTGTKCLSKSNFPLIVNEKKRSKQKQGPTLVVFTWKNRKFQLENQMVHAIPFGKLQKIWAVI